MKRNFDPVTFLPSVYVNGVLFTYWIEEFCPAIDEAITVPTTVDLNADMDTAVAQGRIAYHDETFYGYYYTGITRDDAGGLRYLYQTNNVNLENSGPTGTTTYSTNTTASQLLYTSNLVSLANSAATNSDANLAALFPGVVFNAAAATYWTNVWTTNVTAYYTNSPWDPIGTAAHLAFVTNTTVAVQPAYIHNFANLYLVAQVNGVWTNIPVSDINTLVRPAFATLQTVKVAPAPFAAVASGVMRTNVTTQNFLTNIIAGEYFFLPTNACSLVMVANQLTFTNTLTNVIYSATNFAGTNGAITPPAGTNVVTSSTNLTYTTQNLLLYSTNHVFVVFPVSCPTNAVSARQGMDRMTSFVRRDYDSLINRYWTPITNTWTGIAVTNNVRYPQTMTRVLTAPDILFAAADLLVVLPPANFTVERSVPNWDTNGVPPNGNYAADNAGPGTIQPNGTETFTFNRVGEVYFNLGPIAMDEATAYTDFLWGSFDGTTNAPIVYPYTADITGYQNQMVMQMFPPPPLPDGQYGTGYSLSYVNPASGAAFSNQFSGTGGAPPYTYAVTPGSALPDGFALQSDGTLTATDGTTPPIPTAVGAYSFSIRMTDSAARFIDTPYTLTITPP